MPHISRMHIWKKEKNPQLHQYLFYFLQYWVIYTSKHLQPVVTYQFPPLEKQGINPWSIAVSQSSISAILPGDNIITCAICYGPATANAAYFIGITACPSILLGLGRSRCPESMWHGIAKKWPPCMEAARWPSAPYPCHAPSATCLWWTSPYMASALTRGCRCLWSWRATNSHTVTHHHPGDPPCSCDGLPSTSYSAYPPTGNFTWPISTDVELCPFPS